MEYPQNEVHTFQRIAHFYPISKELYDKYVEKEFQSSMEKRMTPIEYTSYEDIKNSYIPRRGTGGSAGYDIKSPRRVHLLSGQALVVPTFLKCYIEPGWVLNVYPRSSYGFKYFMMLANTVGIIDSDYFENPDNEGHILIKIVNTGNEVLTFEKGDKFVQGIFNLYGITYDDNPVNDMRNGGIGSTGK